ncbi:ABC transporter permease [Candidatus Woesearchaeota archaeon]|jgi:ABC-type multidrug transport system permease subunit|nr:ABC transporter permease [Candidatus Woesearchaeota archaeon]
MMKLLILIAKNFKLLLRSKTSALIIFIGPLLLVCLLGLAFSKTSGFLLTAGIFSENYTALAEDTISQMESQNFNVIRYEDQLSCINSVKGGETQSCIIFPPDMNISPGKINELTFYVDYSQANLVWIILDSMNAKLNNKTNEISKELVTDILARLSFVEGRIMDAQAELEVLKNKEIDVKNKVLDVKQEVAALDISVDFSSVDLNGVDDASDIIISKTKLIKTAVENNVKTALDKATGTINVLADIKDRTGVLNETKEDVDDAISKLNLLKDTIEETPAYANLQYTEIVNQIGNISGMMNSVDLQLKITKQNVAKISDQRDLLLPEFDNVTSQIEEAIIIINNSDLILQEALDKINGLEIKEAGEIISPITSKVEPITTQKSHFHSLFPALLVIVIMITGILLSSTIMIVEKNSKSFFRNAISPTNYFTFTTANFISTLIILAVQLMMFISVSIFYFQVDILSNFHNIALILFIATVLFIFLGIFLGFIFKTAETVTLASITASSLFLLFSNIIIPLESMPESIKQIAMYNPFVVVETALKKAIVFNFGFEQLLYPHIITLTYYAAGIILLLLVLQGLLKKLAFTHFNFHFSEKKGEIKLTGTSDWGRAEEKFKSQEIDSKHNKDVKDCEDNDDDDLDKETDEEKVELIIDEKNSDHKLSEYSDEERKIEEDKKKKEDEEKLKAEIDKVLSDEDLDDSDRAMLSKI